MDRIDGLTKFAVRIATLGPVGYWPAGPGTVASALVVGAWLATGPPPHLWIGMVVIGTVVATLAAHRAEQVLGHDDGRIVIDEVVGMGVALVMVPATVVGAVSAFAMFRILDIVKPPPINRLQKIPGGWGVVVDDLAAGGVSAVVVWLVLGAGGPA